MSTRKVLKHAICENMSTRKVLKHTIRENMSTQNLKSLSMYQCILWYFMLNILVYILQLMTKGFIKKFIIIFIGSNIAIKNFKFIWHRNFWLFLYNIGCYPLLTIIFMQFPGGILNLETFHDSMFTWGQFSKI